MGGEEKVAGEEKTNDSRGTEVERQGWSIPWGVAAYDRGNGMGVILGCSLPRPWHRPIGGCCYLRLRDLPFTLLSAAETLVGFRQQPPHTRQQRQTRRLQRIVRDHRRSSSPGINPDQPHNFRQGSGKEAPCDSSSCDYHSSL